MLKAVILTFLVSMVPIIELRGAIPIGMSMGLAYWEAFAIGVIGNLVPVPFIILFSRKLLHWLGTKSKLMHRFVTWLDARTSKKLVTVQKYAFWGLLVLVAIPLPGTGAWTGSLVATMLDIRIRKAFPAIALGVVIAGLIVATLMSGAQAVIN